MNLISIEDTLLYKFAYGDRNHKSVNFSFVDGFIYYKGIEHPIALISNRSKLLLFYKYECDVHRELCDEFDIKPFTYYILQEDYISIDGESDKIVNAFGFTISELNYVLDTKSFAIRANYLCIDNEFRVYFVFNVCNHMIKKPPYECCVYLHISVPPNLTEVRYINNMNRLISDNIKCELLAVDLSSNGMIPEELDEDSLNKLLETSEAKQLIIRILDDYCVFSLNSLTEWECSNLIEGIWWEYVRDYYYKSNRNTVKRALV